MIPRILVVGSEGWQERGFGNWLHIYATARKYAELLGGAELVLPDWCHLPSIFVMSHGTHHEAPVIQDVVWPPRPWIGTASLGSFYNFHHFRIYSHADFVRYLVFRRSVLDEYALPPVKVAVHHRNFHGNSDDPQRPHLSLDVLRAGVKSYGLDWRDTVVVSDGGIGRNSRCDWRGYIRDFLTLCYAQHLFLFPCSTFSGFAAYFAAARGSFIYQPTVKCNSAATNCGWLLEPNPIAARGPDKHCVLEGFRP